MHDDDTEIFEVLQTSSTPSLQNEILIQNSILISLFTDSDLSQLKDIIIVVKWTANILRRPYLTHFLTKKCYYKI